MVYAVLANEFGLPRTMLLCLRAKGCPFGIEGDAVKQCEMYKKKALEQPVPAGFWDKLYWAAHNSKMTICQL